MLRHGSKYLILLVNDLLGPLIFTDVNLKRRPAITSSVSYNMGLSPLALAITVPS